MSRKLFLFRTHVGWPLAETSRLAISAHCQYVPVNRLLLGEDSLWCCTPPPPPLFLFSSFPLFNLVSWKIENQQRPEACSWFWFWGWSAFGKVFNSVILAFWYLPPLRCGLCCCICICNLDQTRVRCLPSSSSFQTSDLFAMILGFIVKSRCLPWSFIVQIPLFAMILHCTNPTLPEYSDFQNDVGWCESECEPSLALLQSGAKRSSHLSCNGLVSVNAVSHARPGRFRQCRWPHQFRCILLPLHVCSVQS